jgi:5-methylcytosine-specific restriction protein A
MSSLKKATAFINKEIFEPVFVRQLSEPDNDKLRKLSSTIKHTRIWINRFKSLGDMEDYLTKFTANDQTHKTAALLKSLNFRTFEDILPEFLDKFGGSNDRLTIDKFTVGSIYSSYDIGIITKTYNTQAGGILTALTRDGAAATVLKITIGGKTYKNEWLKQDEILKSYLQKNSSGIFAPESKANQLVIFPSGRSIFCFVRANDSIPFTYSGIFKNIGVFEDTEGNGKWFKLERRSLPETLVDRQKVEMNFAADVAVSSSDDSQTRRNRLKRAPSKPIRITVASEIFVRNPDVVAEVLSLADGKCQGCGKQAPFTRKANGSGYLEVHHKVPLSANGDDTVNNAVALCPNCHRQEHHGTTQRWPWES